MTEAGSSKIMLPRGKKTAAVAVVAVLATLLLSGCLHEEEGEPGWLAVTAWTPHFMFSQWDSEQSMQCLEDPGWEVDGETQYLYPSVKPDDLRPADVDPAEINTYVNADLENDDPEIFGFLQNFQVTAEDENQLMLRLEMGEEHQPVAREYVDNNQDVVDMWLEGVDTDAVQVDSLHIGVPGGWDGEILRSFMVEYILTRDFGIDVEMTELEAGLIYEGLAQEDLNIFVGGWQPIQKSHLEGREDQITKAGDALPPGDVNLCFAVPQFLVDEGVTSLADLADHGDEFGRTITGIESGAGMMITAQEKMEANIYNLGDWTLQDSSTPAMLAAYDDAVKSYEG